MELDTIIQGDCIEEMQAMPDNSIDLVVTSPPYNVGIEYDTFNDKRPYPAYLYWCRQWLAEILRVLKPDGRLCLDHYLSCGTAEYRFAPLMDLNAIALSLGFKHHGIAIWWDITLTKRTAWGSWLSASAPYINSPFEGILILFKDHWKKDRPGATEISKEEFMEACSGVWKIPTDRERLTPATFPVALAERCIRLLSWEGDIVFDPFSGSGTTCIAAKKTGRRFVGIEISPAYCQVARERIMGVSAEVE